MALSSMPQLPSNKPGNLLFPRILEVHTNVFGQIRDYQKRLGDPRAHLSKHQIRQAAKGSSGSHASIAIIRPLTTEQPSRTVSRRRILPKQKVPLYLTSVGAPPNQYLTCHTCDMRLFVVTSTSNYVCGFKRQQ